VAGYARSALDIYGTIPLIKGCAYNWKTKKNSSQGISEREQIHKITSRLTNFALIVTASAAHRLLAGWLAGLDGKLVKLDARTGWMAGHPRAMV